MSLRGENLGRFLFDNFEIKSVSFLFNPFRKGVPTVIAVYSLWQVIMV